LGITFSSNLSFNIHIKEVKQKINKLTKYISRINSNRVPLKLKIQVFNNYISSQISYVMEIAASNSSQLSKLQTLYTSNLKKILGLKQSFNNNILLKFTSVRKPISILVDRFNNSIPNLRLKITDNIPSLDTQLAKVKEAHELNRRANLFIPDNLTQLTLKFLGKSGLFNLEHFNHKLRCHFCGRISDDIEHDIVCFNAHNRTNFTLNYVKDRLNYINLDYSELEFIVDLSNLIIKETYNIDLFKNINSNLLLDSKANRKIALYVYMAFMSHVGHLNFSFYFPFF
jgi:hypothetical protein